MVQCCYGARMLCRQVPERYRYWPQLAGYKDGISTEHRADG